MNAQDPEKGKLVVAGQNLILLLHDRSPAFTDQGYWWENIPPQIDKWQFAQVSKGNPARITVSNQHPTSRVHVIVQDDVAPFPGWDVVEGLTFTTSDANHTRYKVLSRLFKLGEQMPVPVAPGGTIVISPKLEAYQSPAAVSASEFSRKMEEQRKKHEYAALLTTALAAEKAFPKQATYYLGEGHARYALGELAAAIAAWQKGKELDPLAAETIQGFIDNAQAIDTKFPGLPPLKVVPSEMTIRSRTWRDKASALLAAKNYDEIEETVNQLTQSRSATADGTWDLFSFTQGLVGNSASLRLNGEAIWQTQQEQIEAWYRAKPQSRLARVMVANSWYDGAWAARGQNIEIASPELMDQRLAKAAALYSVVHEEPEKTPLEYLSLLRAAVLIPMNRPTYFALFQDAIKQYPDCTPFYTTAAYYLLPRWYGEEGEWEQFAQQSADKVGRAAGDALYARIVWSQLAIFNSSHQNIWDEASLSWPRIQRGFEEILKQNPDSLPAATRYFYLAIRQNKPDVDTALKLLQGPIGGQVDDSLWEIPGLFADNRMWILEKSLQKEKTEVVPLKQGQPRPKQDKYFVSDQMNDGVYSLCMEGENLWLALPVSHSLLKVRTSDFKLLGRYNGGDAAVIYYDGKNIWSADYIRLNLTKFRASDGKVLGVYEIKDVAAAMCSDGENLWLATSGQKSLIKIRLSDGSVVAKYDRGIKSPSSLCFDGKNIWLGDLVNKSLLKLNAEDGSVLGNYTFATPIAGLCFDGEHIWAANFKEKSVTKVRASDGTVVGTYPIGSAPNTIAFDGHNIWTTSAEQAVATKIDGKEGKVLGTYPTGSGPSGICFDNENVWIGNVSELYVTRLDKGN